mmetsp:Transcript_32974/g.79773  ORF Transcript_32974/g.79773 Transcript_32974/m.79773 type:complete len:86 (-) Transcript_32974:580-837(-)
MLAFAMAGGGCVCIGSTISAWLLVLVFSAFGVAADTVTTIIVFRRGKKRRSKLGSGSYAIHIKLNLLFVPSLLLRCTCDVRGLCC